MSMRPRGGGRVGPNRAPRPAVRSVYEDFRPVSERHQEEEAEKLLIFLPGFMKESIRVSTEGKNTVRVRGERFVGGNKWNRFQEDYQAPDDCNMRGIHARFENGILIITMPWKMPKQLDEPTKQTPTLPPPPPKDTDFPPKTTSPTVETRKPTPLKPTAQFPKPQNVDKDQDTRVKEKQRDETLGSAESSKTQKGDNIPPKTTYPTIEAPSKPTRLKPPVQLPKPQIIDKDQDSRGVKEKQRDEKKILEGQLGSAESSKTRKGDEVKDFPTIKTAPLGKTSGEKEKPRDEKKILEGLVGSIGQKIQKSKEENLDQNRTQFVNLKKSLVELNEERQLLVNAGAAALVIMALGAYVYHSIGSGRAE